MGLIYKKKTSYKHLNRGKPGAQLGPIAHYTALQWVGERIFHPNMQVIKTQKPLPKATQTQHQHNSLFTNPDQGGSKWISASTQGSCSHHRFRGEGLYMILVPSSPQISYLITITTIHGWTKTQKIPWSAPQISQAEACGWFDTAKPHTDRSSPHLSWVTVGTLLHENPAV